MLVGFKRALRNFIIWMRVIRVCSISYFLPRLTPTEYSQLIGNLEEILAFQNTFLSAIEECMKWVKEYWSFIPLIMLYKLCLFCQYDMPTKLKITFIFVTWISLITFEVNKMKISCLVVLFQVYGSGQVYKWMQLHLKACLRVIKFIKIKA